MKILHCSDIHLDSPLAGLGRKAKQRRDELTASFCSLVAYAEKHADALVVAGDLFDGAVFSSATLKAVTEAFARAERLKIFLLMGNHDAKSFDAAAVRRLPPNVFLFDQTVTYDLGEVSISGFEMGRERKIAPDPDKFNILVLHGDEKDIDFGFFSKLPIDYLALGHYHRFGCKKFARGLMCYSGSPEPRGFDEPGETGFVMLDTSQKGEKMIERVISAGRKIATAEIDVTGIESGAGLLAAFEEKTAGLPQRDYLNLVLRGRRNKNVDIELLMAKSENFFAFRLEDNTSLAFDKDKLMAEQSVYGEFIRLVWQSGADETVKNAAAERGLFALGWGENP